MLYGLDSLINAVQAAIFKTGITRHSTGVVWIIPWPRLAQREMKRTTKPEKPKISLLCTIVKINQLMSYAYDTAIN